MVDLSWLTSLFTEEEKKFLPRRMRGGRLNRVHCGLWVELSPSRHDLSLADLNNRASGVSVGLRRILTAPA
jgi:hypothetical protein